MISLLKNFKGKKIIITGHTSFKGSWLTLWLTHLGVNVAGISDRIPINPSNFIVNELKKKVRHLTFDIKDKKKLPLTINRVKPDYIFHLVAQSLVKKSYKNPVETFETNSIGILNLLEALKKFNSNKLLKWRSKVLIEKGLRKTIKYFKKTRNKNLDFI